MIDTTCMFMNIEFNAQHAAESMQINDTFRYAQGFEGDCACKQIHPECMY